MLGLPVLLDLHLQARNELHNTSDLYRTESRCSAEYGTFVKKSAEKRRPLVFADGKKPEDNHIKTPRSARSTTRCPAEQRGYGGVRRTQRESREAHEEHIRARGESPQQTLRGSPEDNDVMN